MAQLKDRYSQHNFDNTEDLRSKQFDKAVKSLFDSAKYLKQVAASPALKEGASALGNGAMATLKGGASVAKSGMSALGAVTSATTRVVETKAGQATLAALGPLGYAVSRLLPLANSVTRWMTGSTSGKLSTKEQENIAKKQAKEDREESIKTFESYPTIKKLNSYLEAKLATDDRLEKAFSAIVAFQDNDKKEKKKQSNYFGDFSKSFKLIGTVMNAVLSKQKLVVSLLGIAALSIYSWVKNSKKTVENVKKGGNLLNAALPTPGGKESYKQYTHKEGIDVTSPYGWRDATQSYHKGVDIGYNKPGGGNVIKGDIVASLTDGFAKGYVSYPSGDVEYKGTKEQLSDNPKGCIGFGKYVLVECTQDWKIRLGYPQANSVHIRYGHLSKISIPVGGKNISRGETVGNVGNSGTVGKSGRGVAPHVDISVLVDGIEVTKANKSYLPTKSDVATVDPLSIKSWIDAAGKSTDLVSAYKSLSYPQAEKTEQAIQTIQDWGGAIDEKLFGKDKNKISETDGTSTGGAAGLSTYGKLNGQLTNGNIAYNKPKKTSSSTGYQGTLPNLEEQIKKVNNTLSTSTGGEVTPLNFGATNPAVEIMAKNQAQYNIGIRR